LGGKIKVKAANIGPTKLDFKKIGVRYSPAKKKEGDMKREWSEEAKLKIHNFLGES